MNRGWYDRSVTHRSQIAVAEALGLLQAQAPTPKTETVPLNEALGRTLAQALSSRVDHPSLDNSALDGYACRAADTASATRENPVTLRLVGDVPAGSIFSGAVGAGEAVGIYTGAPIPNGADAIIGVEFTDSSDNQVRLSRPASPRDIRPRAQDLRVGEVYLERGQRLNGAALGVAAAMGYGVVPVAKKPRVGILSTGDEIIKPGEPIQDGQVYNSNSYGLAARVVQAGGEAVRLPNVCDDSELLEKSLAGLALDLLLTSGGVSTGCHDFVRDLLFDKGRVHFWKVAMRPGGQVLFGSLGRLSVLGLPGNPVSIMVVFELLGRAFLNAALGGTEPLPYYTRLPAVAGTPFRGSGFKETFARATLHFDTDGRYIASSTGPQSSGLLWSLLAADALAVVPPYTSIEMGDRLEVIPSDT